MPKLKQSGYLTLSLGFALKLKNYLKEKIN